MEIYIPYIVGGSVSSILGGISYYLYSDTNEKQHENDINDNDNDINDNDINDNDNDEQNTNIHETNLDNPNALHEYSVIDDNLKEEYYYSNKYKQKLGCSTSARFENIIKILNTQCNRKISNTNFNNKIRKKLFRYLKEYERLGHYQFIHKYKK